MFRKSTKPEDTTKYRRRSWFGGTRKHDDKGDPLAGALVALAIISFIGLVGTSLFQFIDRGQAAVVQQVQEGIRADITALVGQRVEVNDTDFATATESVASALNSINTDGNIMYHSLVSTVNYNATTPANTAITTAYDIDIVDANKDFWVFVPHTNIVLCETLETGQATETVPEVKLGADAGAPTVTAGTECPAGDFAAVRKGRAIFVGGVTDTGSHFCVKYTQSNAALDTNGFSYWHLENYHNNTAPTGALANLAKMRADCGVLWLVNHYTGIGAGTVYAPFAVGPGLCAHSDPRPSPQNIPSC